MPYTVFTEIGSLIKALIMLRHDFQGCKGNNFPGIAFIIFWV